MQESGFLLRRLFGTKGHAAALDTHAGLLPALLLFAASLVFYAINLAAPAVDHDELQHILAARSLLERGEPAIAEGYYTRGLLFTWMVAASFAVFGDGLSAARLPAALFMAALVALLFAWLRRESDHRAALWAALLFAFSPFAVELARFARFYAPQMFFVFLGAVCLYAALKPERSGRRRLLLLAAAAASLLLALHFQPTTLFAVLGLGLWACGVLLWAGLRSGWWARRPKLAKGALLALPLFALAGAWLFSDLLVWAWSQYRNTPLFNADTRDAVWYYHLWYMLYYPTLWTLTPLLVLFALYRYPRPTLFLAALFLVGFLLNSFAGPKARRYLGYAQPFLFALWGLSLALLWPRLHALLAEGRARLAGFLVGLGWLRRAALALPAVAVALVVLVNPFWLRSLALIADVRLPFEREDVRLERAAEALAAEVAAADVVVTTMELHMLYVFGRYDLLYNRSRRDELPPSERRDFGTDPRTGRRVIGSLAALLQVVDCYPRGLLVTSQNHWRLDFTIEPEAKRWIESRMEPVPVPEESGVRAFRWRSEVAPGDPRCRALAARWRPPGRPG